MWFKQQKTITAIIEATIEPPMTADGHRLDEMVVCFDCHQLVLKEKAKEVEHEWREPVYDGRNGFITWAPTRRVQHYCPAHAPAWDVVQRGSPEFTNRPHGICYYRRIPAVPERLEQIVEAPVKVTRKRKPKKGTKPCQSKR